MKHIKVFEDYSDEELKDLMGDLKGVGHGNLIFKVDLSKVFGGELGKKQEMEECENWVSEKNPKVYVTKAEGHIDTESMDDDISLKISLSNGDKIEFDLDSDKYDNIHGYKFLGNMKIFTKGKEIEKTTGDEIFNYPGGWILSVLTLYEELI